MIKYIVLLFNMLGVLIYQALFTDQVNITTTAPSSIQAGTEFTVELTVNKGSMGGFAKLQQDLPDGFTAVSGEAKGGEFSFDKQSVKFIWMALPSDASFKVSYRVKVDASVSGEKMIAGKFSYIENNARQSVDIAPFTITVQGSGSDQPVTDNTTSNAGTNDNTASGNEDNTDESASNTGDNSKISGDGNTGPGNEEESNHNETVIGNVTSVRKMPEEIDENGTFKVEVTINKGNISGYAKLQETLPEGFTATAGNVGNASFSFSEQKVRIVWLALPNEPEMKVSYNVKVDKSIAGTGMKAITGIFSYIENEETRKYTIPASSINVKGEETSVALNQDNSNTGNNTQNNALDNTQNNTQDNTQAGAGNKTAGNTAAGNTSANSTSQNNTGNTNSTSSAVNVPSPQTGVMYRVQLAALQNPRQASWFNNHYNIQGQVYTEMHEGFTKYTTGQFQVYKGARDERENIRTKGVEGAFVTAYNNGNRITVQEALMITSQQWYR